MVATKADCSIWLNHSLRTAASPKTRSNKGSRAAMSSRVSFTSKTQTLFTVFLSHERSAKVSPSREPRQAEMPPSEGLKGPKRADRLKCYLGAALETQRLACLVRGGRLSIEHLAE